MTILVTGTAGFIGYHLTKRLLKEGHNVIGLDSINNYYEIDLKWGRLLQCGLKKDEIVREGYSSSENYDFYRYDLCDKQELENIFKTHKIDAVCHLAAQAGVRYSIENPQAYIDSNIYGFQNIIDLVKAFGIKNFCFASSSSVYGGNTKLPFSEKDRVDSPVSLYAATKKSNELIAYTYSHLFGIQTTGLRFFTVYGPWGRPDMAYFSFTKSLIEDKKIKVYNNGNMFRDFTYIDDIIEGVFRIILNPTKKQDSSETNPAGAPYKVYNIGNNKPVKLSDFINTIENVINKKFQINYQKMQPEDVHSTYAEVSLLINDHNYKPNTNLSEGIKNFVDWYMEYYEINIT